MSEMNQQPLTLQQTLDGVNTITTTARKGSYRVDNNTIVAEYVYLNDTTLMDLPDEKLESYFRTVVSFDENTRTYSTLDYVKEGEKMVTPFGAPVFLDRSIGDVKQTQAGFTFSFGGKKDTSDDSPKIVDTYKVSHNDLKTPLFTYLDQAGWAKSKEGVFSRIFKSLRK